MGYNVKNHKHRGGDKLCIGGELCVKSGAKLIVEDGAEVVGVGGGSGDKIEVVVDVVKQTVATGDVSLADVFATMKSEGWSAVNVRLEYNGTPMNFFSVGANLPYWFVLKYFSVETTVTGSTEVPRIKEMWAKVKSDGTVTVETQAKFDGTVVS